MILLPSSAISLSLFPRLLALIYLIAFASLLMAGIAPFPTLILLWLLSLLHQPRRAHGFFVSASR